MDAEELYGELREFIGDLDRELRETLDQTEGKQAQMSSTWMNCDDLLATFCRQLIKDSGKGEFDV